jgi:hypothetical protein
MLGSPGLKRKNVVQDAYVRWHRWIEIHGLHAVVNPDKSPMPPR